MGKIEIIVNEAEQNISHNTDNALSDTLKIEKGKYVYGTLGYRR